MCEQERIAKLIYDALMEDITQKRLGFNVKDATFDTTNPNGCELITLNTDSGLMSLCLALTLNE